MKSIILIEIPGMIVWKRIYYNKDMSPFIDKSIIFPT